MRDVRNMQREPHGAQSNAARCAIALVATIALGLLSRAVTLPGLLAEHTGDALYTVAVFWGLALLRPRTGAAILAATAWLLSAAVEFAQTLDWQWLTSLRATRLGALVLGQGFQWADLVAYAAGACCAWAAGRLIRPQGEH